MTSRKLAVLLSAAALVLSGARSYAGALVVGVAPPAPLVEVVPAPPRLGYVWRPGHWAWNGVRYVWASGVYIAAPRPGASWLPGGWVASRRGWVWVGGHWRR